MSDYKWYSPITDMFEDPTKDYKSLNTPLADPTKTFQQGKKQTMDAMTRAQDQAATQMSGQAGAAGLSGGGGRALGMQSQLGTDMAEKKAQAANQSDQALYNALLARDQTAMQQDQLKMQAKQAQPDWLDTLMGAGSAGAGAAAQLLPLLI